MQTAESTQPARTGYCCVGDMCCYFIPNIPKAGQSTPSSLLDLQEETHVKSDLNFILNNLFHQIPSPVTSKTKFINCQITESICLIKHIFVMPS